MKQAQALTGYIAIFKLISGGGFEVSFPDFPGCVTFGRTFEEAQKKAAEVLGLWLEELRATHQAIPSQAPHPIIAEITPA